MKKSSNIKELELTRNKAKLLLRQSQNKLKKVREKSLENYEINKIPLPAKSGRTPKYPWDKLEIGESFYIPSKTAQDIGGAIYNNNKRKHPKKFTARTVDNGVRIWRIK